MANESIKDSTTSLRIVCAIIFVTFVALYTYSFQGDLLAMIQNAWSEGKTQYDNTVGTITITIVLSLLTGFIAYVTSLPRRFHTLIYFPALVLLGLMTAVQVNGTSVHASTLWLILTPIMLIIWFGAVRSAIFYKPYLTALRRIKFLAMPWWSNLLIMTLSIAIVYTMGNTDKQLHTRLAVERLCNQGAFEEALTEGYAPYDNDSSLTMLRAIALAKTGQMGEKLFTYDIKGGSRSLLPQDDASTAFMFSDGKKLMNETFGFIPCDRKQPVTEIMKWSMRRNRAKDTAKDYILCSYLLDKDLNNFFRTLPVYYNIDSKLPKHYAEAYTMYVSKKGLPDMLNDGAMKAEYADFMDLIHGNTDPTIRHSAIRSAFFGTYWYYYYKVKTEDKQQNS